MCCSPADASVALSDEDTQGGKHGPAAVDQLGLAEPLQAEHLGVGSELVLGHDVAVSGEHTLNGALGVGSSVDVVLVDTCTRAQKQGALQVELQRSQAKGRDSNKGVSVPRTAADAARDPPRLLCCSAL